MKYFGELATLGRDLGPGLMLIGAVSLIPLIVTGIYQEWNLVFWMLIPAVIFFGTGAILRFCLPKTDRRPRTGLSVAATALLWVVVSLVGALPFLYTGISYLDAAFESMSTLSSTGFSVIPDIESWPKTLLFWRTFMLWLGGLGIVVFTLTIASHSGLVARGLYQSEGRADAFMPSAIATAFQMLKIYIVLTGIAIIFILFTGVGLWDAVNLALSTISTGGMSIYADGLAHYDSFGLEMILIPIMIAGSIPFRLYYLTYIHRSVKEILHDHVIHVIIGIFIVISAFLMIELVVSGFTLEESIRQALFMAGSAVSSSGYQNNNNFAGWGFAPIIFMALFTLIGGAQGSTAGGIKFDRVRVMVETLVWWFKKTLLSPRTVLLMKHEGKLLKDEEAHNLISRSLMMIMLFTSLVAITLLILLHDPYFSSNVVGTVFDVFACVGNNGCSMGVIGAAMPEYAKVILFFVMWIARLEIIPVMILIWGIFRGFGWENITKRE